MENDGGFFEVKSCEVASLRLKLRKDPPYCRTNSPGVLMNWGNIRDNYRVGNGMMILFQCTSKIVVMEAYWYPCSPPTNFHHQTWE